LAVRLSEGVVVVKQIERAGVLQQSLRAALLCSAVVGLAGLGGCDDSVSGQATKSALVNTNQAARIAASAGDGRPTDKLKADTSNPMDDASIRAISATVAPSVTDMDKRLKAANALVTVKSVADDLKLAQALLTGVKGATGMPDRAKALVETQAGYTEIQQSQLMLANMESNLQQMAQISTGLQFSALEVADLAKAIEVRQAARTAGMEKIDADLAAAQATLKAAQDAAGEKEQSAKSTADDLENLRKHAAELNSKALADMQAASKMRGQQSIDAYDAAAKVRGQADEILKTVAGREPELSAQQHDAQLAQVKTHEAEERVKTITATKDAATRFQDATDKEIASLKEQIKQIASNEQDGLRKQYDAYVKLQTGLETGAEEALKHTVLARASFDHALAGLSAHASLLSREDPKEELLKKLAEDKDVRALLQIQKAAASFESAEVSILALNALQMQKAMSPNLPDALTAAGIESALPKDIDGKIQHYQTAAFEELHDRANKDIAEADRYTNSAHNNTTKWIQLSVKASVLQAYSMVCPADETAKSATAAQEAVRDALSLNPGLPFPGIAAAPAQ
jgi:hypothetical protein